MSRDSGSLLLELVISLSVVSVGLLAFFSSFVSNFRAGEETARNDDALTALEDVAELLRSGQFEEVYDDFDGALLEIPGVEGPDGGAATIAVSCFVDETSLPAEFGPVLDIDGDGSLQTADASGSYDLLPTRLTLSYWTSSGATSRSIFLVLGPN